MNLNRATLLAAALVFVVNVLPVMADELNLPAFEATFADPGLSRGYWFTSPKNFVITGLRVPTDVGTDPQNIEVMRLGAVPPEYSNSTSSFDVLGYFPAVNTVSFINTNIQVHTGDIIGVLGTRGISVMSNSYSAASTFDSAIFGTPVTLKRFLYQGNLATGPATAVSMETGFPISRVELRYATPEPSTAVLASLTGLGMLLVARRRQRAG
jgi:hypothetical protein